MYIGGGGNFPYCMNASANGLAPPVAGFGPLIIGQEGGAMTDSTSLSSSIISGLFQFQGQRSPGPINTSAATASGNTLTFSSVPAWVYPGLSVTDQTTAGVIPGGTTVSSKTATTVVMSASVTGGGVLNGDAILMQTPGTAPCITLNGGLQTAFNMKWSKDCGTASALLWNWTGQWGAWDVYTNGNVSPSGTPLFRLTSSDGSYVGNNGDGSGYPYFLRGIMLGQKEATYGAERFMDSGTAAPAYSWALRGDVRWNQLPSAGGFGGWIATAAGGATEKAFAPVANESTGVDWTLPAIRHTAPSTSTTNYTVALADYSLIFNGSGSITVTLPTASSFSGRVLILKTIAAQTVVSASSNVVPLAGGSAGTAILAATAGKWAMLQSDGSNWIIMEAN